MKKTKLKIPKEVKPAIIFVGLVALILLGINVLLKPPADKVGIRPENAASGKTVNVYFIKNGQVVPVARNITAADAPLNKASNELIKGPTAEEKTNGYITGIPLGSKILGLGVSGKVAEITFNQKLEDYSGAAGKIETMLAQIVYTATDIPGIDKVLIKIKGRGEVVLGGEGLVLDHPLSRSELRR